MGSIDSRISIVVPVRNGSSRIPDLIKALADLPGVSDYPLLIDLVLIDDGSTDDSWQTIRHYSQVPGNETLTVRGIRLDRGRGQQAAILAGLAVSRNHKVVTMDDDLSHPLEAIPELVSALDKGYDLIYASPPKRPGSFFRRLVSRLHQLNMSLITGSSTSIRVGSYRSLSPDLIDRILREPLSFSYISAQSLTLRPPPRVRMLETAIWKGSSGGRFTLLSLLKLEIRLAWFFGPLRRFGRKRNISGAKTADVAASWIAEVCG